MARARRKTRRDDTWVVKEDEFHPDPGIAAKEADRNALNAALENAKKELERAREAMHAGGNDVKEIRKLAKKRQKQTEEIERIKAALAEMDADPDEAS
jgi:hypothetical protein